MFPWVLTFINFLLSLSSFLLFFFLVAEFYQAQSVAAQSLHPGAK